MCCYRICLHLYRGVHSVQDAARATRKAMGNQETDTHTQKHVKDHMVLASKTIPSRACQGRPDVIPHSFSDHYEPT